MLRQGAGQVGRTAATVSVCGKSYTLRASARSPWLYRAEIGRDIFADVEKIRKKYTEIMDLKIDEDGELVRFAPGELEIFAYIFWAFWREGSPDAAETPEQMLDGCEALPANLLAGVVLALWDANAQMLNTPAEPGRRTVRDASAALFMARCAELGLVGPLLEDVTVGQIFDILTERADDRHDFPTRGTREDALRLFGGQ